MADEEEIIEESSEKKSKIPLIIGLVLALVGAGGGFFAVQSGLLFGHSEAEKTDSHTAHEEAAPMPDVAFVPMDPLVINLGKRSKSDYLRFRAELEVKRGSEGMVTALLPRVLDILNGYLRAVNVEDLEDPSALIRLRAQMLRRIQLVIGREHVRDLLIMEFVLN